jgi:hypothetical protein
MIVNGTADTRPAQGETVHARWRDYICLDSAPECFPVPDFAGVLDADAATDGRIVLRAGMAITSRQRWETPGVLIADATPEVGAARQLLLQQQGPALAARFGLVVLAKRDNALHLPDSDVCRAGLLGQLLIRTQLHYYEQILTRLQQYCSNRTVGARRLSSVSVVQAQLGDAYRRLRLAQEWVLSMAPSGNATALLAEVRVLGDGLCKLAGGRAFLGGGIREAVAVFEILINLYPGDGHA